MEVVVVDIHSPGHHSILPGVTRVSFSETVRPDLGGIWANALGGITINLFGPYVVSCDSPSKALAWQYPLIMRRSNGLC